MTDNEIVVGCAMNGDRLPGRVLTLTAPVRLTNPPELRGVPGKTVITAADGAVGSGAGLISITCPESGDLETGLPRKTRIADFRIKGNGMWLNQHGLILDAACTRLDNLEFVNCYTGFTIGWGVDIIMRDCILSNNCVNVYLPPTPRQITTVRWDGCNIRQAIYGFYLQEGRGLHIHDSIIESNPGYGMYIVRESMAQAILISSSWFENNPIPVNDPTRVVMEHTFVQLK